MTNVTITNNLLKGSGVGILVKYQSSKKKRPKDFVIINNTVNTSNKHC